MPHLNGRRTSHQHPLCSPQRYDPAPAQEAHTNSRSLFVSSVCPSNRSLLLLFQSVELAESFLELSCFRTARDNAPMNVVEPAKLLGSLECLKDLRELAFGHLAHQQDCIVHSVL